MQKSRKNAHLNFTIGTNEFCDYTTLSARLNSEMHRIGQQLTSKVSALAERYAQTLPEIDAAIADLEAKVAAHLKQMGF